MNSLMTNIGSTWKRFWGDSRGAVLFYVTATLPALVGFALLAIDGSRAMTLHTSLQKGVDALALAAAGELDRTPNAMERAEVAVANLLKNRQMFGEGEPVIGADVGINGNSDLNVDLTFYNELPASDNDPMPTSGITVLDPNVDTDNAKARFVQVTVDTYTMNSIFPASFLGGSDSTNVRASAVAGMSQVICRLTPLFICNPWEPTGNTDLYNNLAIYEATDTRLERRKQIRVRMGPGGSGWGPGNYGFLDFGNGAPALEKALAVGAPDNCFAQSGVDTKTGQTTGPVEDGLNVRFGLYPASLHNSITKPYNTNMSVRPARNVRMGQPQNAAKLCREYSPDTDNSNGMALPRDPVFTDPTARIGTSAYPTIAQWTDYWNGNFANYNDGTNPNGWPSREEPGIVGPAITEPAYQAEAAATSWDQLTRYEVYKWEISASAMLEELSGLASTPVGSDEVGNPRDDGTSAPGGARCWKGADLSTDDDDRRLIGVAILNCKALEAAGNKLNGNQTKLPVASFAEFFAVEPLEKGGSGTAGDIYMEFVDIIEAGTEQSVSRDQVQIYR